MRYRRQDSSERIGAARLRALKRRRAVAVVPTLFTLGNLVCGFASMHYAAMGWVPAYPNFMSNYSIAGYLIFLAMLFDSLDGRMARLARATSDFGGELDSLADVVSFGAAPAFLAMELVNDLMTESAKVAEQAALAMAGAMPTTAPVHRPYEALGPAADTMMGRLFWIVGAIYVSCTALRLARFNVMNKHGEEAHMGFRGLPSPGGAGVVASTIVFFEALQPNRHHLFQEHIPMVMEEALKTAFPYVLPAILLAAALLMVSRFSYAHVANQYLRGKRSFGYVVRVAVLVILALWQPKITALLVIYLYAASAPVTWLWRRIFRRNAPALEEKVEERT